MLPELTRTVAVLKALKDLVESEEKNIKLDAMDTMAEIGVERVAATLPDGTVVAHVTRVSPSQALKLLDDEAALEWARKNAPDLVEHVPEKVEVIPAHDRLAIGGAEALIARMEEDGEVIPGIGVAPKNPFLQVRFAPKGRERIAEGLRQSWAIDSVVQGLLTTGEE
jgi:hypothetical protein